MKKIIVSLVIIGTFVLYSVLYAHSGLVADVPTTSVGSRPSASSATATSSTEVPGATVTSNPTAIPTAIPTPRSLYKDGSYTGSVADAQWGLLQVKAIITNGKITNVQFLQYPSDRSRSRYINSVADPQLSSEAIQAQSAKVDAVSGATDSSDAFTQSLSDALAVARA